MWKAVILCQVVVALVVIIARAEERGGERIVHELMERTHEGRRSPYGHLRRILAEGGADWPEVERTVQAFEPMCRALLASTNDDIKGSADGYVDAVKDIAAAVKRRDAAGVRTGFDSLKQSCADCHFQGGVGGSLEEEEEKKEEKENERRED